MTVRAKFTCHERTERRGQIRNPVTGAWGPGSLWEFGFFVVTDGSAEDKAFFASTPSGQVKLGSVRSDLFEVGRNYYLDFIPAGEGVPVVIP